MDVVTTGGRSRPGAKGAGSEPLPLRAVLLRFGPLVVLLLATAPLAPARDAAAQLFASGPDPVVVLGSYHAGGSPEVRLVFGVEAGELEMFQADVDLPPEFVFLGFDQLGPAGTVVGAGELDLDFDGRPERVETLRSLGAAAAWIDVVRDGRFSPDFEPVVTDTGAGLRVDMPLGGDAVRSTVTIPASAQISLVLFAGILVNPPVAGSYLVSARLTSVDPDTDGLDDGAGAGPVRTGFQLEIVIVGAADAAEIPTLSLPAILTLALMLAAIAATRLSR